MSTQVFRGFELKRLLMIFLFPYLMGCSALPERAYLKDIADDSNLYRVISLDLRTADKHRIAATHYYTGRAKVIILAHGFFNNKDSYLFKMISNSLSDSYDVIAFDFRGHGKSSGLFTWTTYEPQDLEEVIRYAKAQGYTHIGVMGFSLGAVVALIVASKNRDINSVIAVSAPFDFGHIDYHFWEPGMLDDLRLNIGCKGKGKGIRPGNPFMEKIKPLNIVSKISPTPVLFIHGSKDWLIKPYHTEKLFKNALEPKKIVIIPNAGHAEMIYDAYPEQFISICKQWFEQTLK